jgi:radical SAM protein with 4Fe4S-binding SPASM domain
MDLTVNKDNADKYKNNFFNGEPFELEVLKFKLNNICNSKCRFCNYWKNDKPVFFDKDVFVQVLNDAKKYGLKKITLSGGEPLLHPNIIFFVKTAFDLDLNVTIITNALLFDSKKVDLINLINKNKLTIVFSLNGADEKAHDYSRGVPGSFSKVIRAIDYLNLCDKRNKIKISVSVTLAEDNSDELSNILNLKTIHPFDSLSFYYARQGVGNQREEIEYSWVKNFLKSKNELLTLADNVGVKKENMLRGFEVFESKLPKKCFLPFLQLEIDFDGETYACCHALESRDLEETSFGNVKNGFDSIWKSKSGTKFRKNCENINYLFCKDCIYKFLNKKISKEILS